MWGRLPLPRTWPRGGHPLARVICRVLTGRAPPTPCGKSPDWPGPNWFASPWRCLERPAVHPPLTPMRLRPCFAASCLRLCWVVSTLPRPAPHTACTGGPHAEACARPVRLPCGHTARVTVLSPLTRTGSSPACAWQVRRPPPADPLPAASGFPGLNHVRAGTGQLPGVLHPHLHAACHYQQQCPRHRPEHGL